MNDFLLGRMHLVELFDEVFFVHAVKLFFRDLYLFKWRECLIHSICLSEGVSVSLLELLDKEKFTVLSS